MTMSATKMVITGTLDLTGNKKEKQKLKKKSAPRMRHK